MVKKLNNIINSQLDCDIPDARSAIPLSEKAIISLQKKSEKHDIPFSILEEVYNRGYSIWNEDFGGTREQFAFDRVNSFVAGGFAVKIDEDLRNWFNPKHPEGGWKRINSKGEAIGPCAREPGEPKPKCMSNEKRKQLTKKERAAAVAAKRRNDPVVDRSGKGGKPVNVSNYGKGKISEEYLEEKNVPTNPSLWSKAKSLARSKFDVYPSAYANGWASKWYKNRGGGWKSVNEEYIDEASFSDRRIMEKHLSSNNFVLKGGSKHERWEHPSGEIIYLPRDKTFADGIVYKTLKAVKKAQGLSEQKLDKKVLTPNQISKKFKVPVKAILKQLNKGQSVEHEHTSSNKTARRIASAHVSEIPDYYNKLSKMEKSKMNERVMSEPHSKNKNKSASRFDASDELVDIYTRDTPGQKKKVLETIKQVIYNKLEEAKTPAWQRKEGKDPKGGLNKKGVASYRAANPGSKLQTAVTTEPSKLKPGSKKAKRRLSFCRRMKGMKNKLTSAKTARDPDSRINKSLRKWNC